VRQWQQQKTLMSSCRHHYLYRREQAVMIIKPQHVLPARTVNGADCPTAPVASRQMKTSCVSRDMNYISHRYARVKWNPRKLTGGNIGSPGNRRGDCWGEGNDGAPMRIFTWIQTRDRSTTNEQEQKPRNVNDKPLQGGEDR
jgi:hypothetical protein